MLVETAVSSTVEDFSNQGTRSLTSGLTVLNPFERPSGPESDKATAGGSAISDSFQPSFRFALPQTFVGKLAATGAKPQKMPIPSVSAVWGKRGGRRMGGEKGCRRKKSYDGRTDIRALPDFDGDPIEE
jgi:hypothetical protein